MEHKFRPSTYFLTYGPNEPAYHISSGDMVVSSTVDARGYDSNGVQIPEAMKQNSRETYYDSSNPLVGPFYVEEAEVGDSLAVEIQGISINRNTAWSGVLSHFGALTEESRGRYFLLNDPLPEIIYQWELDVEKNLGTMKFTRSRRREIQLPLHPFLGCLGVAPPFGRVEPALMPGEFGGNMDCVETKEGATVLLPVFVKGGYLAFGDVHAAQGDGEICGVALETTAEVRIRVQVIKNKAIGWPRIEDDEWLMVAASSRPLMDAFKIAHYELLNWLTTDYGFDRNEGFQVLSQAGRCRVGNVVDPNYTVVAKIPKKYVV